MRFLLLSLFFVSALAGANAEWPLPYANYTHRPVRDARCRVSEHARFCPGEVDIRRLDFDPNDNIDIFVLSQLVSDFALTPMDSFKRIKVGLALHSRKTSKNYTITYSPFSSVLDATVPLLFPKEMLWCNQAAVCVTSKLSAKDWSIRQRVGVIGGDKVDALITWLLYYNNTKPFFETALLKASSKTDFDATQFWRLQFDDTQFLLKTLTLLNNSGAMFFKNSTLHLSSLSLICNTPQLLGPPAQVQKTNPKAFEAARAFFEKLQPSHNVFTRAYHRLMFDIDVNIEGKFYYLFNEALWKLKLASPKMATQSMTLLV